MPMTGVSESDRVLHEIAASLWKMQKCGTVESRSKRFDGYEEHIALDLDFAAIVACAVTAGDPSRGGRWPPINGDIKRQGVRLVELNTDRAYVNSPVVAEVVASGGTVFAKPWGQRSNRPGLFSKHDFKIHLRSKTIACPAGGVEPFEPGATVQFDPKLAALASFALNAPKRHRAVVERYPLPSTSLDSDSSERSNEAARAALT
jgi:hypothetical protein